MCVWLRTLSGTKVRNFGQVRDKSSQVPQDCRLNVTLTYSKRKYLCCPPGPPDPNVVKLLIFVSADLRTFVLKSVRCDENQSATRGRTTLESGVPGGNLKGCRVIYLRTFVPHQ